MLSIQNFELFDGEIFIQQLPRNAFTSSVHVWKVDVGTPGYYVSIQKTGEPSTDPAEETIIEFLGSIELQADPDLLLAARKKELVLSLFARVATMSQSLEEGYSTLEKESWEKQEKEAAELMAVKTPLISALAESRGCSRDYLAQRILENAAAAKEAGTGILAWQQGMEEKIKKMKVEEFTDIWNQINP